MIGEPLELNPELIAPASPFIMVREIGSDGMRELPPAEITVRDQLMGALGDMRREANELSAAVALFDQVSIMPHSSIEAKFTGTDLQTPWRLIAAKSGAISLRNWRDALGDAAGLIGRLPTLKGRIDDKAVKAAIKQFDAAFPRVEKLRHATAHPEFYRDPSVDMTGPKDNLPRWKGGDNIALGPSLMGNTYVATINKLTVQYDVTGDTALAVVGFTRRVFGAFEKAAPIS